MIACARGSRSATSRAVPWAIWALAHESSVDTCNRCAVVAEPVAAAVADPSDDEHRPVDDRGDERARRRALPWRPPSPRPPRLAAAPRRPRPASSAIQSSTSVAGVRDGGGGAWSSTSRAARAAASDATSLSVVVLTPSHTTSTIRSRDAASAVASSLRGCTMPLSQTAATLGAGCSLKWSRSLDRPQAAHRAPAVGVDLATARAAPRREDSGASAGSTARVSVAGSTRGRFPSVSGSRWRASRHTTRRTGRSPRRARRRSGTRSHERPRPDGVGGVDEPDALGPIRRERREIAVRLLGRGRAGRARWPRRRRSSSPGWSPVRLHLGRARR